MSHSTTTKQQDILNTQVNAHNNHKQNSTLVEMDNITGTPFKWVKQDDKYFIVLGNNRLTEPTTTLSETLEKLQTEMFDVIFHTIIVIAQTLINESTKPEPQRYKIPEHAEPMNYETDPQHG